MMYEYLLIVMNSGDSSWSSDTKESQAEDFGYFFSHSLREIFLSFISLTSKTASNPDTGRTSPEAKYLGSNVPSPSMGCKCNSGCNWCSSVFSLPWEQWKIITTLYMVGWGSQIPFQALAKLSWEISLAVLGAVLFGGQVLADIWALEDFRAMGKRVALKTQLREVQREKQEVLLKKAGENLREEGQTADILLSNMHATCVSCLLWSNSATG